MTGSVPNDMKLATITPILKQSNSNFVHPPNIYHPSHNHTRCSSGICIRSYSFVIILFQTTPVTSSNNGKPYTKYVYILGLKLT